MPIFAEVYNAGMPNVDCVFVVDDDDAARNGLARLLRIAGHDVRAFASANQFLEALSTEECGCVVLDSRMPGISGRNLKEELTSRGVRLPIIVVTADDDDETRREAKEMGAAGFFRKPVVGKAMIHVVERALGENQNSNNVHVNSS